MEAIRQELQENVVSTDYVDIAPRHYQFKGGVKYILHYFTFATCWTDKEHIKRFKSAEALRKFYAKLGRGDICNSYGMEVEE